MCGLSGVLPSTQMDERLLQAMMHSLHHRGPDDSGLWRDEQHGMVLIHNRLSIQDLSAAGHQPMLSANARQVLVFNGEIYNHQELRQTLQQAGAAPAWRGHSDTETLLAAFAHWGVIDTLKQLRGMFALVLWNRDTRVLTLARDRFGEKPLYFGWLDAGFAFCSELSALKPLSSLRVHRGAASRFLAKGFVEGHQSIAQGIFRLPPGSCLALQCADLRAQQDWAWIEPRLHRYWPLSMIAQQSQSEHDQAERAEVEMNLENLLRQAVSRCLLADVQVGCLLSGGIDSSLVAALMSQQSPHRVNTYSIGFREQRFDEAPHARAIAAHLGTQHTELYVDDRSALDVVPELGRIYAEPLADSSQIPTLVLMRLVRQHVTVALTGDGGDELFGGYDRYFAVLRLWALQGRLPPSLRPLSAALVRSAGFTLRANRLKRLGHRLGAGDVESLGQRFLSPATRFDFMLEPTASQPIAGGLVRDDLRQLMLADQLSYLPDDILVKVDRAAMSCGLETRAPLLDADIAEFSWKLATASLHHRSQGKQCLRQILNRHVPAALWDRPKAGFEPPLAQWLRGSLREWAEAMLASAKLAEMRLVDSRKIAVLWSRLQRGEDDTLPAIWNVLMLASWKEASGFGTD